MDAEDGANSRGWPSSTPAYFSGTKQHHLAAGHSGTSSGSSTVMLSGVPTPSSTTVNEVRSGQPSPSIESESSTGVGAGAGTGVVVKRSLRRVEGSRRIVAAPPTPPDSDENANAHLGMEEKDQASIKLEENVFSVPGVGTEEISSDGGKRSVLHKGRGRGEDGHVQVEDGAVSEKQVKRMTSATASRWKFWKSSAR